MAYPGNANDTAPSGNPSRGDVGLRWAGRWPYATASVVAVAVWFAASSLLDTLLPDARPAIGWVGYLAGVVIGTRLAGLTGARGWVVVPVITLALGLIAAGGLMILGLHLP
jgi:hypothetical protein